MTKLFFDTEFTGLHRKTTLISIGIVAESGETFYAEYSDYDKSQVDQWLQENVIDNLILSKEGHDNDASLQNWRVYGDRYLIREAIELWLKQFDHVQMWSDCLSYDWVLFCEIWGHAFSIPKNVYYIPFDICPLLLQEIGDADINREEYANSVQLTAVAGSLSGKKHNALWDAYVIRQCYHNLQESIFQSKL